MSAKKARVTRGLLGLVLAAAASGTVILFPSVASAATPTPEHSSVTLSAFTTPVAHGAESQTFSGTVTGKATDGYPTGGTVAVGTTTGKPICSSSLGEGSGDTADFSCTSGTTALPAGSYAVEAVYAGGSSSTPAYSYTGSPSGTKTLRVTTPEPATVTLTTAESTVDYGHEQQTFTGTVAGTSNDGYPTTGTVVVKTTATHIQLCLGSLTAGSASGVTTRFTCRASTPTQLAIGTHTVRAYYAGGESSNATYNYEAESSGTKAIDVVTATTVTVTKVTLNAISSPVADGAETQTFSGTVKGRSGDGYPRTGSVKVEATGQPLCTANLTRSGSSTTAAKFSCSSTTPSLLANGTYSVYAHFTGAVSSNAQYRYEAAASSPQTLKVSSGTATTTTLTLKSTVVALGAETQETFTVTVKGKSGDGYPKGKVTVKTTGGTTVCSSTTRISSDSTTTSSEYSCAPGGSTLSAGGYKVLATYGPTSTHSSSTTGKSYAPSTSAKASLEITSGTPTTSTLSLSAASVQSGHETAETFTVKVTGKGGDGYPKGTVRVKTTTGNALCTTSTATSHGTDYSTFACSPRASALVAGGYSVVAAYTPSATSSSTASVTYAVSTSSDESLTVSASGATRIYGTTADGTAAKELETVYPGSSGTCPGTTSNRPVVLANDAHFPDALAASYLAKWLGTGMLLTPTSALSSVTITALRVEGITHVYVVGGSLAVSTAVVTQLRGTAAYDCRGSTRTGSDITVTRISGATQYTTAEDIAKAPGSGFAGSEDLQGAYGRYNDTVGTSSSAPSGTPRTAILASGAEFQDAEASATIAYADNLPLLLTTPTTLSPQALSAMETLGVTQVILMGGPLAVTDSVVTQLVSHGISALRVAGLTDTDTAVQLADMELASTTGHLGLGWTPTGGVTVSRGNGFTDGLAGAVVAAHGGTTGGRPQPMLLTENPTTVGTPLSTFLRTAGTHGIDSDGSPVVSLTVLGGSLAITTSVVTQMEADL